VGDITFKSVQNLTARSPHNSFVFSNGGHIDGTLNGFVAGKLDYSTSSMPTVVNLATKTATGVGTFAGITALMGAAAPGNTILGPAAKTTWTVSGPNSGMVSSAGDIVDFNEFEKLIGGAGDDTFIINDGAAVAGIDGGGGSNTLSYQGSSQNAIADLGMTRATGVGAFANIASFFGNGSGKNTIIGPNGANDWTVSGLDTGRLGTYSFELFDNLTGGPQRDAFVFHDGGSLTGVIDGGGGGDWLDYSAYSGAVEVRLTAGTATGVSANVANIQNVRGSATANNILVGSAQGGVLIGGGGQNTIQSGGGRSILISGQGSGSVTGTKADDILIGGSTTYDPSGDANDAALSAILAEWQSHESYKLRVKHLEKGGGVNGGNVLIGGATVRVGGGHHTLIGRGGQDLVFKGSHDKKR
jgi:hypothetical protein